MKTLFMKLALLLLLPASMLIPVEARAAEVWSGCMTITGVSDYIAYDGQVFVYFATPLPGVAQVGAGYAWVTGQNGVTSDNISGFLATALAAKLSNTPVMVFYDNTTGYLIIMSVGGYAGQCN
jgi:hypothetical protein